MPDVIYVVYDVTNNRVIDDYYDTIRDATNMVKSLKSVNPDNKYHLIAYRRCMICDA
jgi:hypothetical protein